MIMPAPRPPKSAPSSDRLAIHEPWRRHLSHVFSWASFTSAAPRKVHFLTKKLTGD